MVFKVLVSFPFSKELDEITERVALEFKKMRVQAHIEKKSLLSDIDDFLTVNRDCNVLIIKEGLENNFSINSRYFDRFRRKCPELVIILISQNEHYKTSYIKNIFECNIYNCLFLKDASIENIVYISLNPRTKVEAESYYGLMNSSKNSGDNYCDKENIIVRKIQRRNKEDSSVMVKEKIIYKPPRDYQKIIGVYSPYPVGKTVIASNLAKYYSANKMDVTLIDTDFNKKDLLYYFPLEDRDFLKLVQLHKDLSMGKEVIDVEPYGIEMKNNLMLFTDHRDSEYEVTFQMVNLIVRSSKSNITIIDIASNLEKKLINEILELCDEKLIIADKMISTLNGLPYKLALNNYNSKNLSLVINRNIESKGFSNSSLMRYFKNIQIKDNEMYSFDFDNIFFIPNRFELIVNSAADRQVAYGKDSEFDESIKQIADSLYQMSSSSNTGGIKGFIKKLARL